MNPRVKTVVNVFHVLSSQEDAASPEIWVFSFNYDSEFGSKEFEAIALGTKILTNNCSMPTWLFLGTTPKTERKMRNTLLPTLLDEDHSSYNFISGQ